jgi:hypothetical protein
MRGSRLRSSASSSGGRDSKAVAGHYGKREGGTGAGQLSMVSETTAGPGRSQPVFYLEIVIDAPFANKTTDIALTSISR